MIPPLLQDIMWLYAQRGIADWQNAPSALRRRAEKCLGSEIADNDTEAAVTLETIHNGLNADRLRFIPMPQHPKHPGIERSFLLPVSEVRDGKPTVAFELFLLVAGTNCLAYRFEPAHAAPSSHDYGHVQNSRTVLRKTILASTLSWMPDRYPANPLCTSDPLRMFLSIATAMHGYTNGVLRVIQDVYTAASRPRDAAVYVQELKKMLS